MKLTLALCAALTLTAAGCADEPDRAACKAAMVQQFEDAERTGKEGTRPDECAGLTDTQIERIAGEIITERLGF